MDFVTGGSQEGQAPSTLRTEGEEVSKQPLRTGLK